jgi:hypothetical protein
MLLPFLVGFIEEEDGATHFAVAAMQSGAAGVSASDGSVTGHLDLGSVGSAKIVDD